MDIMSFSLKHCQRKASLSQKKIKRGEAWVAHLKNCCLQLCKKSHFRTDVHSNYPPLHFSVLIVTGHTNMTNCQPAFSHLNSLYFFICILFFVFGFPFAKLETFAFLFLHMLIWSQKIVLKVCPQSVYVEIYATFTTKKHNLSFFRQKGCFSIPAKLKQCLQIWCMPHLHILRIENWGLRTEDWGPRNKDSGLRIQDQRLRTGDWGLRTED